MESCRRRRQRTLRLERQHKGKRRSKSHPRTWTASNGSELCGSCHSVSAYRAIENASLRSSVFELARNDRVPLHQFVASCVLVFQRICLERPTTSATRHVTRVGGIVARPLACPKSAGRARAGRRVA